MNEVPGSEVILVIRDNIVQANILLAGSRYHIRYVGENLGQAIHALQEIDTSRFPPEHPPGYEIGGILVEDVVAGDSQDGGIALPAQPDSPAPVDGAGSIIDVLVVYTPAAREAVGGTAAMNARIDLAITETNQGYANSGVHQRMHLVYRSEIDYDSNTGDPFFDALGRLQNSSDGYLDEVRQELPELPDQKQARFQEQYGRPIPRPTPQASTSVVAIRKLCGLATRGRNDVHVTETNPLGCVT